MFWYYYSPLVFFHFMFVYLTFAKVIDVVAAEGARDRGEREREITKSLIIIDDHECMRI